MSDDLLSLVAPKRGHFRLESGHHSGLWLDLNGLFTEPRRTQTFIPELVRVIEPHHVTGISKQ